MVKALVLEFQTKASLYHVKLTGERRHGKLAVRMTYVDCCVNELVHICEDCFARARLAAGELVWEINEMLRATGHDVDAELTLLIPTMAEEIEAWSNTLVSEDAHRDEVAAAARADVPAKPNVNHGRRVEWITRVGATNPSVAMHPNPLAVNVSKMIIDTDDGSRYATTYRKAMEELGWEYTPTPAMRLAGMTFEEAIRLYKETM